MKDPIIAALEKRIKNLPAVEAVQKESMVLTQAEEMFFEEATEKLDALGDFKTKIGGEGGLIYSAKDMKNNLLFIKKAFEGNWYTGETLQEVILFRTRYSAFVRLGRIKTKPNQLKQL